MKLVKTTNYDITFSVVSHMDWGGNLKYLVYKEKVDTLEQSLDLLHEAQFKSPYEHWKICLNVEIEDERV